MSEKDWNKAARSQVGPNQVEKKKHALFEGTVLPYFNSAYNLARWLTRNQQDAEDIVQEALLRALRSFDTFIQGRDARAWLLTIVRNSCRTWLRKNRSRDLAIPIDETVPVSTDLWSDPEASLIRNANAKQIRQAMETLPLEYREILVLRELEELSYKEIAGIAEIPLGTVMSRLARARRELYSRLAKAGEPI
jgi:RNA polymerase sigma-70 factor (ECF subfamily)